MQENRSPSDLHTPWVEKWPLTVLGFIMWIGTAAFGLYAIYMGRQIVVRLVYSLAKELPSATLAGTISTFVLALVWLWYVIVGGEVSLKRIHQRKSWTFLIGGAVVELLIWLVYIII